MKKISVLCMVLFFVLILNTWGFADDPYNLWVSGLSVDRKDVAPGDTVDVTYQLRANGNLFGQLDMEIFVRSGPNGVSAAKWSIPSSEGANMGSGHILSGSRPVRIPDWGDGTYFISIVANMNHFLGESNYNDNSMEVLLMLSRLRRFTPVGTTC